MSPQPNPVISIEISDIGDRIGGKIPVTIAATGKRILLPAAEVIFEYHRVIMPMWLRDKYMRYLKPSKKECQTMGRSEIVDLNASDAACFFE